MRLSRNRLRRMILQEIRRLSESDVVKKGDPGFSKAKAITLTGPQMKAVNDLSVRSVGKGSYRLYFRLSEDPDQDEVTVSNVKGDLASKKTKLVKKLKSSLKKKTTRERFNIGKYYKITTGFKDNSWELFYKKIVQNN